MIHVSNQYQYQQLYDTKDRTTMKTLAIAVTITWTSSLPLIAAQCSEECSCSPQTFVFRLALSASCPALPPPFPPKDVFGAGVNDYTCVIGLEPIPSGGTTQQPTDNTDYFTKFGIEEIDINELEWSSGNLTSSSSSVEVSVEPANVALVPVSIYSIQFLEVDCNFDVINQDSSYVRDIDFVDGDTFNYTSISEEMDPGVVPGGMNLVLRGVTAAGELVRNVFTITYTNDCGIQTFEEGNAIGWVVFVSVPISSVNLSSRSLILLNYMYVTS